MSTSTNQTSEPSISDIVRLGAIDPILFARTFFPNTFRQETPEFHRVIWESLENPTFRHLAVEVFRGGAKTTLLRTFAARRVAYGLSRTILFVSRSQEYAIESVVWLQKQVLHNRLYAETFGLKPGVKWTFDNMEILHGVDGHSIRVLARGITGQTRGLNIDDYRPDLIVVDDADDEETTNTPEMRRKTSELFFGAIEKSLTPASEMPYAKIVLLQTPLHRDDLVETCLRDPQWHGLRFGCFRDDDGESQWPQRFPKEQLELDKQAHNHRRQLSLWMREMECKVISTETAYFSLDWLKYWETLPDGMWTVLAIDPAPPQSDQAILKNRDTDYQAFAVMGFNRGNAYLLEYALVRNQNPEESAHEFMRLALKWNPRQVIVEGVAYQRTLAHYLRQKMAQTGRFYAVKEVIDRRKKHDRIRQALAGRAANGKLHIHSTHVDFTSQFGDYPDVKHDDLLDAVSMAITAAEGMGQSLTEDSTITAEYRRLDDEEKDIPELPDRRFAL